MKLSNLCLLALAGTSTVFAEKGSKAASSITSSSRLSLEARQSFLVQIANRKWLYAGARISNVIFSTVIQELERYDYISTNAAATTQNIISAVELITHIALTTAAIPNTSGTSFVTIGADNGGAVKRRDTAMVGNITHVSSWDLSDEGAHALANRYSNRTIIGSELRSQILDSGINNITFVLAHGASGHVPILAYAVNNRTNAFHTQWQRPGNLTTKRDSTYSEHQAFFAANGAGIKLTMQAPIAATDPPASSSDATQIANALAQDLILNRAGYTYVGYDEIYSNNGAQGHAICYIPEQSGFGLNEETNLCF